MNKIIKLSRSSKRLISVFTDCIFIFVAFWSSLFLTTSSGQSQDWRELSILLVCTAPIVLFINVKLGLYRAIIRYLGSKAIIAVALSVASASTVLALNTIVLAIEIPKSMVFVFMNLLFLTIGGSRFLLRFIMFERKKKHKINVLIYGAGATGRELLTALQKGDQYNPVGLIDDNLSSYQINNVKVYSSSALPFIVQKRKVEMVLLAVPAMKKSRRAEIISQLEKLYVEVKSVPRMKDIVIGKARIDELRDVTVNELLGRDTVPPNPDLMHADIKDKVVMVTGAGGSIGSELCRQIMKQQPKSLILFEVSEFNLYSIYEELSKSPKVLAQDIKIHAILGQVQNKQRVYSVLKAFKVETIYHAAAYKHVPIVENNVIEGITNNIFGTLHCAQAAIEAKVSTFVLISTDKAVRPTNTMGTTKRMAELVLQALAEKYQTNEKSTRFCMVRFGNVLGSSGSVVPLFKKQIKSGGPITLTHKQITRYFMTIPEAAQLVIQAGSLGMGGDVFVLDMGKSVKIFDLAYKMIHLSGLHLKHEGNPDGDIEIVETGLRPGEKLYEELLIGDDVIPTGNDRIMSANEAFLPWEELSEVLIELQLACDNFDQERVRQILLTAPTGFKPVDDICDLVYLNNSKNKYLEIAE
ncbi:polysaccharide biosynthesis protein [Thalassotalea litorea]|uniref:Polysaccharide biosynthesis protein n=1 Tax=Thalassotalea litorea TaxID=2020715 RepID=A0A5R9IIH3_9GAMM|nr:nucleoside-diphosphate sugar epimerase/dehydratase [Thalassotalea litorea]TLU65102.1 polysaccharide biosynthesis protein [Thalassotalea litorea]